MAETGAVRLISVETLDTVAQWRLSRNISAPAFAVFAPDGASLIAAVGDITDEKDDDLLRLDLTGVTDLLPSLAYPGERPRTAEFFVQDRFAVSNALIADAMEEFSFDDCSCRRAH